MEPATFAAPLAVQATPRRIPTTTLTAPVSGDRTRWRLLRALAGPTNLAPFHQPPNARRHRPAPPSAQTPR